MSADKKWEKDGSLMNLIPAGSFEMGDSVNKLFDGISMKNAQPVHKVELDDFYMDTTEVTVGQFKKFLKSTDHTFDGELWAKVYAVSPTNKHPMVYVSWHDATAYAKWAGKRLPTEAEWEFAARGGLVGKEFSWGDDESIAREYANFYGVLGRDQWDETTAPVGSFRPNGYGLHDMAGNVWEFCEDWYSEDKKYRVLRGGSWGSNPYYLRAAYRTTAPPSHPGSYHGFRCVSGSK